MLLTAQEHIEELLLCSAGLIIFAAIGGYIYVSLIQIEIEPILSSWCALFVGVSFMLGLTVFIPCLILLTVYYPLRKGRG